MGPGRKAIMSSWQVVSIAALLVTILADGPQVLEVSMRRHPIIENQADDIIIDALLAPKVSA